MNDTKTTNEEQVLAADRSTPENVLQPFCI